MSVDIVIIGGSIVGSAVAYILARTGQAGKVAVVEPDPSYAFSATSVASGGIRKLLSLSENILMARYGLDFHQLPRGDGSRDRQCPSQIYAQLCSLLSP